MTGLSGGCGTSTIAAGLRRELPAARVIDGFAPASADVLVVVAGSAGLPVLAGLVTDRLRRRHAARRCWSPTGRRTRANGSALGAICVPHSRLGVLLLAKGRRPVGPFGAALRRVAAAVDGSAPKSAP